MDLPIELWSHLRSDVPGAADASTRRADADLLFQAAIAQDLFPLLMDRTDLPPELEQARPRYQALASAYRKRYALSRDATIELLRIVGTETLLFYKGADYRHRLYARPELRPMADIDALVPHAALAHAKACLARAGYQPKYAAYGDVFLPGYHETRYDILGTPVDLHTSFGQRIRSTIDYAQLWERREQFSSDGVVAYRLAPADALLAQAFNLAKDEFASPLSRHLDFCLLLQSQNHALDDCVARARAWRMERAFFGALHLHARLFPSCTTPQTEAAMQGLLTPRVRAVMVQHVLPEPIRDAPGRPLPRHKQLRCKFALIDQPWRRLAFVGYHLYASAVGTAVGWPLRLRRSRTDTGRGN
jgi:hypothetical protein